MGRVAATLGRPLLPWQQLVADIAGEVLPDGRMAYPLVVLLVPRRAGKTVLTLATSLQRCTIRRDARAWYTAQTGSDAGATFRDEWVPLVRRSPLAPALRVRLSNGSQRFSLPDELGGRFGVFAPTESSLHGQDSDLVTVDEAWWFPEDKGAELEAAIRPTMLTRPHRQLVIISAGGTADSTWLLRLRELGRSVVDEGRSSAAGLCYVEWYPPDGADLEDPAVWAATHPAVGHTVDLATLQQDRATMGRATFQRSYLNVFSDRVADRLIPAAEWEACAVPRATAAAWHPLGRLSFGYDVAADRAHGAIVAAGTGPDGRQLVELVRYERGTEWMPAELARLRRAHRAKLYADAVGPVTTVTAELGRTGTPTVTVPTGRLVTACAQLLDDVTAHRLAHTGQAQLDTAAATVARRELGDAWAWTRRRSGADISPLVAATVALTGVRRTAAAAPRILSTAS